MSDKLKAIIVEDEEDEARSMQLVLESAGFSTVLAKDGREALAKARDCDIIVLDIILPRLHGDSVLRQLKEQKIKKPVVVVTAVSREVGVEKDIKKIKKDAAFLQKPFSSADLIAAVKNKLKN